ncbi:hypothetical protein [Halalkalicoccus subterraneus]|uniref:hypothetical protein n=1 Tax=Halalkalicoccus subterraneus TaxID=2675002 RepID=UPI000EFDA847|nr:hypothetical protein [Halalkalicoccus subterraneus]
MNSDERPAVRYRFAEPVDLLTAFEKAGIEHLEVSNERTIVIYNRTIFNVTAPTGRLNDVQTVSIEVFDISPDVDADTDPVSLIDRLIEETATVISSDWERHHE